MELKLELRLEKVLSILKSIKVPREQRVGIASLLLIERAYAWYHTGRKVRTLMFGRRLRKICVQVLVSRVRGWISTKPIPTIKTL